jgi:hydrogenase maturation protease
MSPRRILIAGIGNIFFGDDAFGCEVARRLASRPQPDGVRVVDFGIRGLDLAYSLQDYEVVILLDASPRGGRPGTVYLMELERPGPPNAVHQSTTFIDGHSLNPANVLRLAGDLGGELGRIFLIGCEPRAVADPEEMLMGMSEAVNAGVEEAIVLAESLVAQLLQVEIAALPVKGDDL